MEQEKKKGGAPRKFDHHALKMEFLTASTGDYFRRGMTAKEFSAKKGISYRYLRKILKKYIFEQIHSF